MLDEKYVIKVEKLLSKYSDNYSLAKINSLGIKFY